MNSEIDYLFFSPFALIEKHARLEHLVAKEFHESGKKVAVVHCGNVLKSWCVAYGSKSLPVEVSLIEKALTCAQCKQHRDVLKQDSNIPTMLLDDYVNDADIQEWQEIDLLLTEDNWIDFKHDGVPFGRYWSYDTILERKTDQFDTSPEVFRRFKSEAKSGFLAYKAATRIEQKFTVLNVGTHSFQYGINRSFLAGFNEKNTNLFSFTQAGLITQNDDFVAITKTDKFRFLARDPKLISLMSAPIDEDSLPLLEANAFDQIQSAHAWAVSVPRSKLTSEEIREQLKLTGDKPLICVLTSSPDEAMAANNAELLDKEALSIDDANFLQNCLSVARECTELNFVIRIHPRLTFNQRENIVSPWLEPMLRMLEDRPSNVVLNKPGDGIGLYDIAMVTDAILNYRSTAGAEMLMLGIPVVLADPSQMRSYPPFIGLNSPLNDAASIAKIVREALKNYDAKKHIVLTQRWLSLSNGNAYSRVKLAEEAPINEYSEINTGQISLQSSGDRPLRQMLRRIKVLKYFVLAMRLVKIKRSGVLKDRLSQYLRGRSISLDVVEEKIQEPRWLDVPNISNENIALQDEHEIEVITRLNQFIIKHLEPWDGNEGAIRNLKLFPEKFLKN